MILALAAASLFTCTVTKVHDGDGPIHCRERGDDGKPIKIRLQAVAAREMDGTCNANQPCPKASAGAAKAALERLTLRQVLRCEKTGMSYGRTTAWCWRADGVEVNCAMIRSGTTLRWAQYDRQRRLCRQVGQTP